MEVYQILKVFDFGLLRKLLAWFFTLFFRFSTYTCIICSDCNLTGKYAKANDTDTAQTQAQRRPQNYSSYSLFVQIKFWSILSQPQPTTLAFSNATDFKNSVV